MADIFIVEDDPVIAREMDNFLTSWGHNVKCAQDFKNVTAEFADFNPQLVLLDISLPFFNGYCRCREIRKLSDVPIIFISSAAVSRAWVRSSIFWIISLYLSIPQSVPGPFQGSWPGGPAH